MKLWKISQTANNDYDTYDSAIVAANTEGEARAIHPSGGDWPKRGHLVGHTWAKAPRSVRVELVGTAARGTKAGVVLASFNAG